MQKNNPGKVQYADVIVGVLLLLFCAFIYIDTGKMPVISQNTLGSAFFPRLLAGVLTLLSVLLILSGLLSKSGAKYFFLEAEKSKNLIDLLIVTFLIILYGLLWNTVPFLVSSPVLIAVLCLIFKLKIKTSLTMTVGLPLVLFLIFRNGLHVMLK